MNHHNLVMDFNLGDLVVFGFKGLDVSTETQKTILKYGISNVILFGPNHPTNKNYSSKQQLIELTDQLQSIRNNLKLPMMISADQEGGRVQRFKNEFTVLPSALKVSQKNSTQLAFELAQIQAKELFAAGIQLNFAPVCDINTNPLNPVIGDRAFGADEPTVSKIVTAIVRGHLTQNVQACIKHFPGHGDTHTDSHYALPTVHTDLETLRNREWIPFHRSMKSGCNFLMSAHIMLPHIDADFPGTLSKVFLNKFLREELLYQGIVVSDDMEMHAITKHFGSTEAPILALEAGCDLLCYRTEEEAIIAMDAIERAIKDKRLSVTQLQLSVDRVRKIRSQFKLAKNEMTQVERLNLIGCAEHISFAQQF
jgi:beta-N-acetylhexosaminidase